MAATPFLNPLRRRSEAYRHPAYADANPVSMEALEKESNAPVRYPFMFAILGMLAVGFWVIVLGGLLYTLLV